MTDALDALIAAMQSPGRAAADGDPRDYEAAWEMRHDPEADLDRMEDRYEAEMDRRWE